MPLMRKRLFFALILCANTQALYSQQTGLGERKLATSQLKAIEKLQVQTLDGKTWHAKNHRGRFVVVNFWATWCKPCVKEMPDFQALSQRSDVSVLGLAYEEAEDKALLAFLKKVKVTYPVSKVDVYAPLPAPLEVPRGLPTTLVFDRNGDLLKKFLGPVTKADLEQTINAAIKK
jgi:thiol-disulfide isomerase/thioredoxin